MKTPKGVFVVFTQSGKHVGDWTITVGCVHNGLRDSAYPEYLHPPQNTEAVLKSSIGSLKTELLQYLRDLKGNYAAELPAGNCGNGKHSRRQESPEITAFKDAVGLCRVAIETVGALREESDTSEAEKRIDELEAWHRLKKNQKIVHDAFAKPGHNGHANAAAIRLQCFSKRLRSENC